MIEGLDAWEAEEAAKRAIEGDKAWEHSATKRAAERARHVELGWINEDGSPGPNAPRDDADDEDDEDDE